ncbi:MULTISPECIES: alpha/beta fold hydrolase [Myxococcus]|uniref:Proline iminopeptidase n=1 Tax=Myxococcus xanthus TaxID=34 RepID=A0AAE6FXN0_MYXXA|nr:MULTISPECIES: alpha/beta fold hydrolase [Myxococcus]QDE67052.1 alpha/beta hydrolase [Myxococcus xanthus]QDE74326.1 alpha/beta hydrolase [Myxococcus xanthus]QDE81593.1 alpha/beta hydrolase [Myxococcus xanthus]QDF03245.1 alpha/beta hydrolase [Myxococcus xanthus]WAM28170.1 alpha/beta fold hydrolase [Myxococcus sp. NMCA1]
MRKESWLALAALLLGSIQAQAQEAPGPHDRAEAVKIIAELRKIVAPEGMERTEKLRLGGIDQWVSIRSRDLRNPVLLVLHGGPGWVAMPTSWYVAHGWDEFFTVIQWDQRGSGKTYVANDPAMVAPTLTVEQVHADAEELVKWARQTFGKEKIFVLGHSWGSLLGLTLAERHPEWLHAYIGAAQGIDARESERRGWAWTMEQARATKNEEAIRDLESIAPYAVGKKPVPLKDIRLQRRWLNFFGGAAYRRPDASFEGAAVNLSPEYTDEEVRQVWKAQELSVERLLSAVLTADLSHVKRLKTPLILFLGRHDHNVSAMVAAEWFAGVKAPSKQLVWFEQSAHELMAEEPGKVLLSLVRHARPFAERAGDVAPASTK